MRTTIGAVRVSTKIAIVGLLFAVASPSQADPINYGDFEGTDVWYRGVTEDANSADDEPPLFGEPTVSGNSIDFDPVGFSASADGDGDNDLTDGNLRFDVEAKELRAITTLTLQEAGDATLSGFGTNATFASVTTQGTIEIFEVDGVAIDEINVPFSMAFSPSDGTYELAADGGGGPLFTAEWSGSHTLNVAQVLNDNNVPFEFGATKVSVNFDNTMTALSEDGTASLIAKKDADGVVVIINIPEPATVVMMALCAVCGMAVVGRYR